MNIRANKRDNCTITSKWKDFSTNVNVRAMKIWVEKLGNTLFGVNSRIRTRDGICCQGILLPRFTGRSLDKNNEMKSFQQPQASSSTFQYRFRRTCSQKKSCFQKICSQKKSFCSGLVNILISSLQLIFTRACHIHYCDCSPILSQWLYSIILWNRDIFSQIWHSTCSFSTKTENLVSKQDEIYFTSHSLQFTPNRKHLTKYDMVTSLRNLGLKTFAIF